MTMNSQQVQRFVLTYLEATGCSVIERTPNHVTVKLSPEADKALTNRPYYWGYVERTGVPAQTMSFTFIFDGEAYRTAQESSMDNMSSTKNTSIPRHKHNRGKDHNKPQCPAVRRRIRSWAVTSAMFQRYHSWGLDVFCRRSFAMGVVGCIKFLKQHGMEENMSICSSSPMLINYPPILPQCMKPGSASATRSNLPVI